MGIKKHSFEYIYNFLKNKGFTVLDESYINAKSPIIFMDDFGYLYKSNFSNLKQGKIPRIADARSEYSVRNIKLWLINNDKKFELISEQYLSKDENNLFFKCNICTHVWNASWGSILNGGRGCPNCAGNIKFTHNYVVSYLKNIGYTLLSNKYENIDSKISFKDSDGYKYYTSLYLIKKNDSFEKFSSSNIYTLENINLWCILENKNFYCISEKYESSTEKLIWMCKKCNREFKCNWNYINQGSCCNICNKSIGENKIYEILKKYNILFNTQHTFNDCVFKRNLPFDFYLEECNLCIEYHGAQHYTPIKYYGGENGFELRKKLDKIKKDYCMNNDINFLEIPYFEFKNIEEILLNKIKELGGE